MTTAAGKIITIFLSIQGFTQAAAAVGSSATCQARTPTALQQLLNQWSDRAQRSTSQETGAAARHQALLREMEACSANINQAGLHGCFDNLRNYVTTQANINRPDHAGGFNVPDRQYVNEMNRANPNLLTLPPEFSNGLPANWREVVARNRQNGWTALEYRSWSVENPSGDYSRVLIHIDRPGFDQWIQFTVPDSPRPGQQSRSSLINVIGVTKGFNPTFAYAEYGLNGQGAHPNMNMPYPYSCVACHPSGMRRIVPAPGSVRPEQMAALEAMNERMASYEVGRANFQRLDTSNLGPHRGATQSCRGCHDNQGAEYDMPRGTLVAGTARSSQLLSEQMEHKMTVEFSMPPGLETQAAFAAFFRARNKVSELNDQQRSELYSRYRPLPEAQHNRVILDYLRSKGKLTEQEHGAAVQALQALTRQQTESFARIQREYPAQMRRWLRGNQENCVTAAPPAAPAAPAPPTDDSTAAR